MSHERFDDLFAALMAEGWDLLNPSAWRSVENETVTWELEHVRHNRRITIDFHLFGELGGPTSSLNDVLYGQVCDERAKIMFSKRNSAEWPDAVREFVRAVRETREEST